MHKMKIVRSLCRPCLTRSVGRLHSLSWREIVGINLLKVPPASSCIVRLLTYVRLTNAAEAVDEFERRFRPLLDQEALEEWRTVTAPLKRD
jgi:hypothetical protein